MGVSCSPPQRESAAYTPVTEYSYVPGSMTRDTGYGTCHYTYAAQRANRRVC